MSKDFIIPGYKVVLQIDFLSLRIWNVTGGRSGLTCPSVSNVSGDYLLCKDLSIPDCSDRTVYCTYPPATLTQGSVTIKNNPSSVYKKAPGKSFSGF